MAHKPEKPPSNKVSRLLPALAFGTPFGVFLLIGLGIIVIEHFIEKPLPEIQITQNTRTPKAGATSNSASASSENTLPDATISTSSPKQSNKIKADAYLIGLDKKQVELRIKRTELLLEYTEQYPDVVQIDRQLEQLQDERRRHVRQLQTNQKN